MSAPDVPDDVTGAATPLIIEIANRYANTAACLVSDEHSNGVNAHIIKTAMYEFLAEVREQEAQAWPAQRFDHG